MWPSVVVYSKGNCFIQLAQSPLVPEHAEALSWSQSQCQGALLMNISLFVTGIGVAHRKCIMLTIIIPDTSIAKEILYDGKHYS